MGNLCLPKSNKKKVGYYSKKATCCGPPILDCYYGPKYIGSITDEDLNVNIVFFFSETIKALFNT